METIKISRGLVSFQMLYCDTFIMITLNMLEIKYTYYAVSIRMSEN